MTADDGLVDARETLVPALAPFHAEDTPSLELIIAAWLDTKGKRTGSGRTERAYRETMTRFRERLAVLGLDLDSADERKIALVAQTFADEREADERPVAPGTHNHRLAVISSFYEFARRRRLLVRLNPMEMVERRPDRAYQSASPLDAREVARRLNTIDRETLDGLRDYALLAIGVSTGRRLSELAGMRWGSIEIAGGVVTLTFQKAKGSKVMRDQLTRPVGDALLRWVYRWYGAGIGRVTPDAPIWVALEPNARGHMLTTQSISNICKKRLGTSKVHALRHTFAHGMEAVGANVSEIQARLGHSNLATTGRYLAALRSAENSHGDELTVLFGLK